MHKKEKRSGRTFLVIGIIFVLLALGLTSYNLYESHRAGESAQKAVDEISKNLPDKLKTGSYGMDAKETLFIDGYEYIGKITIPELGLELPVMSEWDYERLEISPCRFTGSCATDDLVIAGHNYISHFAPLKGISINADVYFTTVNGTVFHYIVDNVETLKPTQIENLVTGDWDLTIFTCNMGGKTRHTVRCIRDDD